MGNTSGEFIWYELMTSDVDAAEAFYSGILGWTGEATDTPGMDYRLFKAGNEQIGGLMGLSDEMVAGGARPAWMGYIAVDDVDSSVEAIQAAGGQLVVPPGDIPNVGRFAMVADPQGIRFYVLNDTSGATSRAFEVRTPGHCAWNELATPDPRAALEFYCQHVGWRAGDTMPMGHMGNYLMFDLDDTTIGGIMSSESTEAPPMWRFYFRVPALAPALEQVRSAGGEVVHGPQEVPNRDEIAIGIDPQGARFALVAAIAGN